MREDWRAALAELGIVRTTERAALLAESGILHVLENKRRQLNLDLPTVGQVRSWIDEAGRMAVGCPGRAPSGAKISVCTTPCLRV